jgi:hypothetical protein
MFATDAKMSLTKINSDPTLPSLMTLYHWFESQPHFEKSYARARSIQYDLQAESLAEEAERARLGDVVTERSGTDLKGNPINSREVRTFDNVERAKLVISTRQWLLAKARPKKYGLQPVQVEGNDALQELLGAFRQRSTEIDNAG